MAQTTRVEANFLDDWELHIEEQLKGMGYALPTELSLHEKCLRFLNVLRRRIPLAERQVFVSKELTCPGKHEQGLKILLREARTGEDLFSHLSRRILNLDFDDKLLNDWGIHHFHLGLELDPQYSKHGLLKGTREVLFARVTSSAFYAIDVMGHKWTEKRLLEILHANWPQTIARYKLRDISGTKHQVEADELSQFRRAGVQAVLELADGTVYAPIGGGYATSGRSVEVVRNCDYLKALLTDLEAQFIGRADVYATLAREKGAAIGSTLRLRLRIEGSKIFADDELSAARFELWDLSKKAG